MSVAPDSSTIPTTDDGVVGDTAHPPSSVNVGPASLQERRETDPAANIVSLNETAYRINFIFDDVGRYRRSSKRHINWQFGFADLSAMREGKTGEECRGEEQEVILLWSVKSGKTRVFWNKRDISHLFRRKGKSEVVEFNWESRNGKKFEIVAHARRVTGQPQYDLLVEGVSFFSLPTIAQLGVTSPVPTQVVHDIPEAITEIEVEAHENILNDEAAPPIVTVTENKDAANAAPAVLRTSVTSVDSLPVDDLDFRWLVAGFDQDEQRDQKDVQDELQSDMYSHTHEALRKKVTTCIPGTEEMVSRAIIKAFSEEQDSQSSFDSLPCDSKTLPAAQIESDVLCETDDWVALNVAYAPRPDVDDQKQHFMQKQIDAMFTQARHQRLTVDAATRILVNVAICLGRNVSVPIPKDTVVIGNLRKSVDVDDLTSALSEFGQVKSAAVTKSQSFGICRFVEEASTHRACAAAESGSLSIRGLTPTISLLSFLSQRDHPDPGPFMPPQLIAEPSIAKPKIAKRQSSGHQRSKCNVDALFETGRIRPDRLDPAIISPVSQRSTLRRDVFTNIPARSTPPVFDALNENEDEVNVITPTNNAFH